MKKLCIMFAFVLVVVLYACDAKQVQSGPVQIPDTTNVDVLQLFDTTLVGSDTTQRE